MKMKASSLKAKSLAISLMISLVSFGVMAYISNRWMVDDFHKDYKEKAILMANNLLHDLREGMLYKPHDAITLSLNYYRKYPEVEELRVFGRDGKEVFGAGPATIETRVDEALRTGKTVQFDKRIGQKNVTVFLIPLKNGSDCQACHGKSEPMRGAILLSLSKKEMEKSLWHERSRFLWLFALIAGAMGTLTVAAVDRFLVRRLKPIQSGAEAIEAGGFGHLIPVGSDDEIGSLTQYINRMSQKLQTFFRELEEKNKQLTEQFGIISRSQREWQETFDNISNPIAVVDHHHALVRANKTFRGTFEECFSRDRGEAIRTWNEYFGPPFSYGTGPSSQKDRAPSTWEIHQQKTGKIFEVSLFPYFSPGGGKMGSVVILKDITQKKEGEMELIMTERLAALGQMASGIAHELNTPLATIAACNEGLLNRVEKENIGSLLFRSYLKIIEEEIQRCKKITTGMLSFVRRPDHDRREVDVNEVLDKTIDMMTFQGRLKEVALAKNVERTMPKVLGNEGELMQVFLAIIVNALDAMEDKGTLTLETGSDDSTIFAKIGDSGPGIPPDLISRIFEPFYTTKSERGGTGLGLSIADKIIKTHNGKIEVTSEEGKGSTFKIILPGIN